MEYDAAGFIKSITPQQVPIAATKAVAQPQVPIETKPTDRYAEFQKRYDDELNAQIEFERHPDLFNDTPGGWSNVQLVLDHIAEHHDGYLSRANISDAVTTLQRRGELLTLFRPEPAKPVAKQPETQVVVVQKQAEQARPPIDPEAGLPPLPQFVVRALGSNKLRNRKDVYAVPTALYSSLLKGPHAEAFRNRVNAALVR